MNPHERNDSPIELRVGLPVVATRAQRASVVDVHAHHFPAALGLAGRTPIGPRWPRLVRDGEASGSIQLGDQVFRRVTSDLWDVAERLKILDRVGIDLQVLSPVPIMLTYWADPSAAADYCRVVNDALAADVHSAPGRLLGLATVPLQAPDLAAEELARAVGTLGLNGVEIGTSIHGQDLDDPAMRPFWAAAESLGAAVFVHPMDGGGGVVRRAGQPYDFGMGMLTDTSIAATSLVFGGVLQQFPRLRICLAHGCGVFPWVYPRLRMAHQVWGSGPAEDADARMRSLWVDTLVLDPEHLRLLVHRFGADKVVIGTDHPFFPQITATAASFVLRAAEGQVVGDDAVVPILGRNALRFLGIDTQITGGLSEAPAAPDASGRG
jgi:aminocarboxymuconate-semialdehyde decarboxylase